MNSAGGRGGRPRGWALTSLALILLAAGCSAFERKVEYTPYPVYEEIEVPCIAAKKVVEPDWATRALRKADSGDDKVKALLTEREQHAYYEKQLREACK